MITARLAPYVMRENIHAAQLAGREDVLARYRRLSHLLTGRKNANVEDGALWAQMMLDKLKLPTLSEYGVCSTSFEQVARDAMKSNAIKGNPIPLTSERLIYILNQVCACRGECVDADIEAHRHGAVLLIHDSAEEESSKLSG